MTRNLNPGSRRALLQLYHGIGIPRYNRDTQHGRGLEQTVLALQRRGLIDTETA